MDQSLDEELFEFAEKYATYKYMYDSPCCKCTKYHTLYNLHNTSHNTSHTKK